MPNTASELSRRLAQVAEEVCRHYLPAGRREGRYWLVGDVRNTRGRSLYVRLRGPDTGPGAAGKWTDAATGERGDLLDLIAANLGLATLHDAFDEARRFLALPQPQPWSPEPPVPQGSPQAARRLLALSKPIRGTIAETYLHERGLTDLRNCGALRSHPHCWYRPDANDQTLRDAWPALIAAVTDATGTVTGVHRTWLDPSGRTKAPVATPRRSMGLILGHGVRIGRSADVMAVGEGLETMLSLRMALPGMTMIAAGSATHLDALILSAGLRRLYVAQDEDAAGRRATASVIARAEARGIEGVALTPTGGDFNDDLRQLGREALRLNLRPQLAPEDVERFWRLDEEPRRLRSGLGS